MKKVFALFVGMIMLFSFAACGSSEEDDAAGDASAGDMIMLSINTDGMGQIAYAQEGEELAFNDEFPVQPDCVVVIDSLQVLSPETWEEFEL